MARVARTAELKRQSIETTNNELQSASLCDSWLREVGAHHIALDVMKSLIMATAGHSLDQPDPTYSIFLDADLSILGSERARYDEYAEQIRREFAFVSDDNYRCGRVAVLRKFLNRDRLYSNAGVASQLEQSGRDNLQREIARLLSHPND